MSPAAAIALSGIAAASVRMTVSASALANAQDAPAAPQGAPAASAVTVKPASLLAFDPAPPVAGAQGLADLPDIDPISEISNHMAASNAFAASLEAFQAANAEEKTLLDMKF